MKLDHRVVGISAWRRCTNNSERGAPGPSPKFRIISTRNVHKKALSIENAIGVYVCVCRWCWRTIGIHNTVVTRRRRTVIACNRSNKIVPIFAIILRGRVSIPQTGSKTFVNYERHGSTWTVPLLSSSLYIDGSQWLHRNAIDPVEALFDLTGTGSITRDHCRFAAICVSFSHWYFRLTRYSISYTVIIFSRKCMCSFLSFIIYPRPFHTAHRKKKKKRNEKEILFELFLNEIAATTRTRCFHSARRLWMLWNDDRSGSLRSIFTIVTGTPRINLNATRLYTFNATLSPCTFVYYKYTNMR